MTGFLGKAYSPRSADETRDLYDDWAASYEAEVAQNGYATPGRCAEALAAHVGDMSTPILDFGCGTGLSGLALKLAGFEAIDGADLSADMLKQAAEKSTYQTLTQVEATDPIPAGYSVMAAIGVIGAGAAPISLFHALMTALPSGGLLVFSFNDQALKDPANEAAVAEWIDPGAAHL